jgi:hypothetical protein
MANTDVLTTLQGYLVDQGKGINIPPTVSEQFGVAIGTIITEIFSGSIQLNGVAFSLSGSSAVATVQGTGSAAPLLQQIQVTAKFTAQTSGVQLMLSGVIESTWPLSNAWPSVLNQYPFNQLTLASGTLLLNANPGDQNFELDVSATASLENTPLGTGLLVVSYGEQKLGFLGGFVASGTWKPFAHWPVLSNLTIQGEGGAFLSTITVNDLSAFSSLKLPYVPSQIGPGLTFIGSITLTGALQAIETILPSGSTLELLANLPLNSESGGTVMASLTEPTTHQSFQFKSLSLTWASQNPESGTITITTEAQANFNNNLLDIAGSGTFTYGSDPTLGLSLTVTGQGDWTHPFDIQNLTIKSFSIGLTLSEEGVGVDFQGKIEVGTGEPNPVLLTVGGGVEDFELPDYIEASLSAENPNAQVTLPNLVQDFIPTINLDNVPLLKNIAFEDLAFMAVAAPVEIDGQSYLPGIGVTGDISFFGYDLDFGFSLVTSPSVAVKAMGVVSTKGGGPIVISALGTQILKISDTTGTKGPSACIDTSGSNFCAAVGALPGAYFYINAAIDLLGLTASLLVQATGDSFEFQATLGASNVFTSTLSCQFIPDQGDFAAAAAMNFNPPSISFPSVGSGARSLPAFSIATPQASFCVALGTIMPSTAPCADGWMPQSAPYFHLELSFSWVCDFNFDIDVELSNAGQAFNNFEQFILSQIWNLASQLLNFVFQAVSCFAKILLKIGQAFYDVLKAVFDLFGGDWQDAFNNVKAAFQELFGSICSVQTGNDAMSSQSSTAFEREPTVLADLAERPGANDLLYHYYLNRPELESRMSEASPIHGKVRDVISSYQKQPGYDRTRMIPLAIHVINTVAEGASEQFKASAAAVIPILEPHRNATYAEFVAAF